MKHVSALGRLCCAAVRNVHVKPRDEGRVWQHDAESHLLGDVGGVAHPGAHCGARVPEPDVGVDGELQHGWLKGSAQAHHKSRNLQLFNVKLRKSFKA